MAGDGKVAIGFKLGAAKGNASQRRAIGSAMRGEEAEKKAEERDYVTTVDDTGALVSADPNKKSGQLVIPKLENTFQVGTGRSKPRAPSYIPTADESARALPSQTPKFSPRCADLPPRPSGKTEDRFETATDVDQQDVNISYGLNKRSR